MKNTYAVVFDLDETLGSFSQLYKFWNLTKIYLNNNDLHEKYFFKLIDMFPGFIRPDILKILDMLKNKKENNICDYVMIYTNNNAPEYWVNLIKSYFHHKLDYELFDKIIRAFKINGKQIELCRTSYGKSFKDFINCTKLPKSTKVCFLDDQMHNEMNHDNVLYINIQPYYYNIKYSIMANNFYNKYSDLFKNKKEDFIEFINVNTSNHNLNKLHKTKVEKNIELLISSYMNREISKFLKNNKNITRKNKSN